MNENHVSDGEFSANGTKEEMEARMRRLEEALAAMSDTKKIEDQVLEKVKSRMEIELPPPPPVAALAPPLQPAQPALPPEMLIEAGKAMLPGALNAVGSHLGAMTDPRNVQPAGSYLAPRTWLLTDIALELRTVVVLLRDRRFRPSWTMRTLPLVCLTIFIISQVVLSWFKLAGPLGELLHFILIPILTILTYKTLSREANRYGSEIGRLPKR